MKKLLLPGIVLVALLISIGINLNQYFENKEFIRKMERFSSELEKAKANNFLVIDSLTGITKTKDSVIDYKINENKVLFKRVQLLVEKNVQHEKSLSNIHDADSIASLFARYYPHSY